MTNVVATPAPAELAKEEAPRLVKMRRFGAGEGSTLLISLGSGAVILAVWWFVADLRLVPHLFLPTPKEVSTAAVAIFQDGYANATLFEHVGASLLRVFTAVAIAIVLGTPIGLHMGLNKWVKGAGVRSVSQERINAALSLGATRVQLLREVVFPSALPEILTGIRISLGVGWGTLVAAELIAATRGIGCLIMSASQFLATDVVFVGIGIMAACAFAFTFAMRLLEAWLVPWKGQN
jgi:taurine transport system permease protein